VSQTPHVKATVSILLNGLVETMMKQGFGHVPANKKDLREGYMVLKVFMNNQQDLVKEGSRALEEAGTTFAYIQDNQESDSKKKTSNTF
jgi:hypothetical protein